jgi:hypothetical protein
MRIVEMKMDLLLPRSGGAGAVAGVSAATVWDGVDVAGPGAAA